MRSASVRTWVSSSITFASLPNCSGPVVDSRQSRSWRSVHHRREDRVRAHVLLCWLALLLIRVIENDSGHAWHQLERLFRPLMVAQTSTKHGIESERNAVTSEQKRVLDALRVKAPARFPDVPTPPRACSYQHPSRPAGRNRRTRRPSCHLDGTTCRLT